MVYSILHFTVKCKRKFQRARGYLDVLQTKEVAISNGIDVKTLQEALGHHDPGFTLRVYGHSPDVLKREAAVKMNSFVESIDAKCQKQKYTK